MQMVINVAPVSLSIKKVNFYTCPRLTFLKKNATENAYKSISEPLDFKIFWGACPQTPQRLAPSALETCLVSFSSLATALQIFKIRGRALKFFFSAYSRKIHTPEGFIFAREASMVIFIEESLSSLAMPKWWNFKHFRHYHILARTNSKITTAMTAASTLKWQWFTRAHYLVSRKSRYFSRPCPRS